MGGQPAGWCAHDAAALCLQITCCCIPQSTTRQLAALPAPCHAAPTCVLLCVLQMYRELGIVDPSSTLNHDQFTALLSNIDKGLRALPATAQVGPWHGLERLEAWLAVLMWSDTPGKHCVCTFASPLPTWRRSSSSSCLQVAKQQGEYLAAALKAADGNMDGKCCSPLCRAWKVGQSMCLSCQPLDRCLLAVDRACIALTSCPTYAHIVSSPSSPWLC